MNEAIKKVIKYKLKKKFYKKNQTFVTNKFLFSFKNFVQILKSL